MSDARTGHRADHAWAQRVLRNAQRTGNNTCAICGRNIDWQLKFPDPMSPSADHKLPWSDAPALRRDIRNGQPTHLRCNQQRGRKPLNAVPPPASRDW